MEHPRQPERPDSAEPVQLPNEFFTRDLPRIRDLAELKVLLTVYRLTAATASAPFVEELALLAEPDLVQGLRLRGATRTPDDDILRGIELGLAHDTLLRFRSGDADTPTYWLALATPENRRRLTRLQRGELSLPHADAGASPIEVDRPNVFRLYEQNVGLVTPIIADQLIEALELYPESWIEAAIEEAVSYNRRNWRYIQRILERWATGGRGDETNQRGQGPAEAADRAKHLHGKYAWLFRQRE